MSIEPAPASQTQDLDLFKSSHLFLWHHYERLHLTLSRVGTELVIRLKWGQTEYKGTLESIDSYMNVLLRDTEEFLDGKNTGSLGLVLIRCVSLSFLFLDFGLD